MAGKVKKGMASTIALATLCIACLVAGSLLLKSGALQGEALPKQGARKVSGPWHEMVDMRYLCSYKGDTLFSINADTFTIRKKKIGLFRFGLLSEAFLKNGVIDIYNSRWQEMKNATQDQDADLEGKSPAMSDFLFKEIIPTGQVKRLASMEIRPVSFSFHDARQGESKISAKAASVRLKERDILFVGDVMVESGATVLTTGSLRLDPGKEEITVNSRFSISTADKQKTGNTLTVDIFLKSLSL